MHHRMGSYFDSTGVIMPPPGSMAPPKKGILCVPPPPPPTSSIPSGKNKQRQLSVSTTELPIRPSLVSKGLGSEGPTRCEFIWILSWICKRHKKIKVNYWVKKQRQLSDKCKKLVKLTDVIQNVFSIEFCQILFFAKHDLELFKIYPTKNSYVFKFCGREKIKVLNVDQILYFTFEFSKVSYCTFELSNLNV